MPISVPALRDLAQRSHMTVMRRNYADAGLKYGTGMPQRVGDSLANDPRLLNGELTL